MRKVSKKHVVVGDGNLMWFDSAVVERRLFFSLSLILFSIRLRFEWALLVRRYLFVIYVLHSDR